MLTRLATIALVLTSLSTLAQVPLGGHVYVPSTTDSTNGLIILQFNVDGNCSVVTPAPNCSETYANGSAVGADGPYVGAIYIYAAVALTGGNIVSLPFSPGRSYFVNNTSGYNIVLSGGTGPTVTVAPGATSQVWTDGISGYYQVGALAGIINGTANLALNFPGNSTFTLGSSTSTNNSYFALAHGIGAGGSTMCWTGDAGNALGFFVGSTSTPATCAGAFEAGFYFANGTPTGGYAESVRALYMAPPYSQAACTTAATVDPVNGNSQNLPLTQGDACALTFNQPARGTANVLLKIVQSATTPFNGTITTSGVTWLNGGSPPPIPATSGAVVFASCYLDGSATWCSSGTGGATASSTSANFNSVYYVDGFTNALYPGIGVAQAAWSSGTYPACSAVSSSNASSAWSIASNIVTVTAANGYVAGQQVIFTSPTFNGGTATALTIIQTGLSSTQFEAAYTGSGSATEAGTAVGSFLAVGTTTGITPGTNSAVWYPVPNSGTPTQTDCAFYTAASVAVAEGNNVTLKFGDSSFASLYKTNIGLHEPVFYLVNLEGQYTGYNGGATTLQAARNFGGWIVTHDDVLSSSSSPYGWHVANIAFDANNFALGAMNTGAYKLSKFENLYVHNLPTNNTFVVPFKFGDGSPASGYTGGGYQNQYSNIFVAGQGNGQSSWATVTAAGTTPTFTVSAGGSYVNIPQNVFLLGHTAAGNFINPCTTMPTLTTTYTGTGPYVLSSVTATGGSGCSGTYEVVVPDMSNFPYGIMVNSQTDGDTSGLQVSNAGWKYGIFYNGSSSNLFLHGHVYGGVNQVQIFDGGQNSHVGEEFDSVFDVGGSSNNAGTSWTSSSMVQGGGAAMNPYAVEFSFPSGTGSIQNSFCNNTATSANVFTLVAGYNGALIPHAGNYGPINVQNGQQCDVLKPDNSFYAALTAPATNTYAVAAGSVNALTVPSTVFTLTVGTELSFLPNLANTSTTPTLNVNGLGAVTITKFGNAALAPGDLSTSAVAKVIYDGTYFELQNPGTLAVSVTAPVPPSQLAVNFNGFVTVPPVGASVYPNQQTFGSAGWTFCGFSCSGGYSGGTSAPTWNVTSPSLTNNAIEIQVSGNSGGGSPVGTNAQVYRALDCTTLPGGVCNGFTDAARTLSEYVPVGSAVPQGLEGPNVVAYDGAYQYYPSVQCATNSGSLTPTIPTYNAWTGTTWTSPDSTSCASVESAQGVAQIWQVHYSFNFTTHQFCYQDLMVNGTPVAKWQHKNLCYSAIADVTTAAVKIQQQLDGNTTSSPTTIYYDYDNASFWATGAAGSTSLSSLTAAAAANTIANGNNPQTWNWSQTTAAQTAMAFGEGAAATGAGSRLVSASTLANSTATPLTVAQGAQSGTTAPNAMNITATYNNGALNPIGLNMVFTETADGVACYVCIYGGPSGSSLEYAFYNGQFETPGNITSNGAGNNTAVFGGNSAAGIVNATGNVGSGQFGGASNSGTSAGSNGGLTALTAGMLTAAAPTATSLEGAVQIQSAYLKGTAIAAVGDVVCGTTTAFTVKDCPITAATNVIGIADTTANPIGVVTNGIALVSLDGALTAIGDNVCLSTTTAGKGHDNASAGTACTLGTSVGVIIADVGTITVQTGITQTAIAMSTTLVLVELHIGQ